MKLSVRAFALTASLIWGGGILLVGAINLVSPDYGKAFLELCSSVYPGYHAIRSLGSVIVGTLYGLVDGAICGAVFAWLYNLLAGKFA
jgi:predicted DNA repair protein MutK